MRDIHDWCINCKREGMVCVQCLRTYIFRKEVETNKPMSYISKLERTKNDYQI